MQIMARPYASPEAFIQSLGEVPQNVADEFVCGVRTEVDSTTVYPELFEVLDRLTRYGFPLALISNLATPYREPVDRLGLTPYFQVRAFSDEIGMLKPDPRVFHGVAERLNCLPENVIMVGDSLGSDFNGALTAGMQALLVDRKGKHRRDPFVTDLRGLLVYLGIAEPSVKK